MDSHTLAAKLRVSGLMNRKLLLILSSTLLVSAGVNVYLYTEVQRFEEAWIEQLVATSEVEGILKESRADTSIEGVQRLAIARFGSGSVQMAEVADIHFKSSADKKGLQVNETLLLFKDGVFYGSKANLPMH